MVEEKGLVKETQAGCGGILTFSPHIHSQVVVVYQSEAQHTREDAGRKREEGERQREEEEEAEELSAPQDCQPTPSSTHATRHPPVERFN
ncbi:hypothetical protein NQZ68_002137 [Dissostichus eleginoides]|nr:hypothetical protein NQZ68_002137 [Dissostichus eleginoides]